MNNLKKLRLKNGKTLREVSDEFGVSSTSISTWESGKIPELRVAQLAEYFGVTSQELLGDDAGDYFDFGNTHAMSSASEMDKSDLQIAQELSIVVNLYKAGYLSDSEFEQAKRRILYE